MLKSILPVVALALCTPLFAGNKLVSDPFRAVHQSWKTHPVAGRDFWLLLSPQWLNLKGLENETFIRESGTGFVPFHSSGRNIMPMRVLSLESVKCFDRRVNVNASANSVHMYGTTFDISYKRFYKVEDPDGRPMQDVRADTLKLVLSEVLRDLKKKDMCYIKYELKQACFHITAR